MGMCSLQLLSPISFSPTQTSSDYWWPRHPNLEAEMSLRKCHTYVPNLRATQQNSNRPSTHRNSNHCSIRHHSNHRPKKCQWYMSVQIPECPISSFQDLRDKLSMFCPCVSLGHPRSHCWFLWMFLWILPYFLTLNFARV